MCSQLQRLTSGKLSEENNGILHNYLSADNDYLPGCAGDSCGYTKVETMRFYRWLGCNVFGVHVWWYRFISDNLDNHYLICEYCNRVKFTKTKKR